MAISLKCSRGPGAHCREWWYRALAPGNPLRSFGIENMHVVRIDSDVHRLVLKDRRVGPDLDGEAPFITQVYVDELLRADELNDPNSAMGVASAADGTGRRSCGLAPSTTRWPTCTRLAR